MSLEKQRVAIIGAGLAGVEAAWQLANHKIKVVLYEMRPHRKTEAHKTSDFAELVCSNSLKSKDLSTAHGLLKREMALAGSLVVDCAEKSSLPAGSALAVDKKMFSKLIEEKIKEHPFIEIVNEEVSDLISLKNQFEYVIVATGPLSSQGITDSLLDVIKDQELYFYDSIAPIIYKESLDFKKVFRASRYQAEKGDYLNCPFNESEYQNFYQNLITAEKVKFRDFEKPKHFEGCLPIETIAERGYQTLLFGPFKPVGFIESGLKENPFAVMQLRQENKEDTLYNLVGCQTRMTYTEQKKVFRMVPGLENCEFANFGSMHRNTYINAPKHLTESLELKSFKNVFLAGQISGVEGYTESAASGLWAAMNIVQLTQNKQIQNPDQTTMMFALVNHIVSSSLENFQPMSVNFGLLKKIDGPKIKKKKDRKLNQAQTALKNWEIFLNNLNW